MRREGGVKGGEEEREEKGRRERGSRKENKKEGEWRREE